MRSQQTWAHSNGCQRLWDTVRHSWVVWGGAHTCMPGRDRRCTLSQQEHVQPPAAVSAPPPNTAAGVAAELALTARSVSGIEAVSLGLVSTCYDSREALMAGVLAAAASIAARSPLAVAGTKAVLLHTRWVTG